MSRGLIRRSAGFWVAVAVVLTAWLTEGPLITVVSLAAAFALSLAARILRYRGVRFTARRDLLSIPVAGISWTLAGAADLAAPAGRVVRSAGGLHPLAGASAGALIHTHLTAPWATALDFLVGGAVVSSLFVARALRRPERLAGEASDAAMARARAIVAVHGEDSLSPYILRPDKQFGFVGDAVVAYRVIGDTVVISGDPVGASDDAAEAVESLVRRAHRAGLHVAAYGASERHLATFRTLGLRASVAGEEAVVAPRSFTLEGRPVRKLRQSVHRVSRRGWTITIQRGRDIDAELEAEIDAVEAEWRGGQARMLGFTMSMGAFDLGIRPDDVYALAWSPEQRLHGVMRFLAYGEKLSLDAMRRVGETPNGLNEALVCHTLEFARERGIDQVSLNYAGLAHLVRHDVGQGRAKRLLTRTLLRPLRRRFQMDRLVLFNEKFSPVWQPRYLLYESRAALPRAVLRVLQAEGYVAPPRGADSVRHPGPWHPHVALGHRSAR